MSKRVMRFIAKQGGVLLSSMAIVVGIASVNSACMLWFHQPKVPQEMNKFIKTCSMS